MKHTRDDKHGRPRLLIVGPLPPPVGGVETVTKAVLGSPALGGFQVSHCNTTKGRPKQTQGKFDLGNIKWALIHFSRMWRSCWAHRPHVVYMPVTATWSGFWRDSVLAAIGRFFGARVVGHVHGAWFDRVLERTGLTGRLVRACLSLFDALLMLGSVWKRMVEDYGYKGQVFVVPSTLSRELFDEGIRFERTYRVSVPQGLFVGQVGERKGVFDLLAALRRLKDEGRAAKIVLVGPGEDEGEWEALMQRRAELGIEDLAEFVGPLEGEPLRDRFRRADFLVLPSHSEGLPVVFFEAGAFGMPVIGTPVGAITDLLAHEVNALLITPGDIPGLAGAINRLMASEHDRQTLGSTLRHSIAAYHPDRVCEQIAKAITELLRRRGCLGGRGKAVSEPE